MKSNQISLSIVAGLALFVTSCSTSDESTNPTKDQVNPPIEELVEDESAQETSYFLPSALQIGSVFQKSGLKYSGGVINEPGNVSKYESKTSKLLNFGTYSADLAYCILNGQSQVAMNQLTSLKALADGLGMESIFGSDKMFRQFENNMGNQDSIIDVMIQIQEKLDMYIDDNDMQSSANIMFAGAWIEGMYIGVKATNEEKEERITKRLVEQMVILDNLVKAVQSVENATTDLTAIEDQLKSLKIFFDGLEEVKSAEGVRDIELTINHLKEIADRIVEMRQSIVDPV
jgi:hypothetical protein|tara:strand:+ start:1358 stop:2221 length:864 start_codon:yes stop_codon:yes gene_type:complete